MSTNSHDAKSSEICKGPNVVVLAVGFFSGESYWGHL